jgi:hypothetical protein
MIGHLDQTASKKYPVSSYNSMKLRFCLPLLCRPAAAKSTTSKATKILRSWPNEEDTRVTLKYFTNTKPKLQNLLEGGI